MAKTSAQIESQIARLQREAEALKTKEASGVIKRIKEAIDHYGLTAADLGLGASRTRKASAPARAAAKKAPRRAAAKKPAGIIKFRDDSGNSWTGHGRAPRWFKEALDAGKTAEDLEVKEV